MDFPEASDRKKVGRYPALVGSGGGYFYDELLEYRVWLHPEEGNDYFWSFPTYEEAAAFSLSNTGAEPPLALVLQIEHVNEPRPGIYEHVKGKRMAEWSVEWLEGAKRRKNSIALFLLKKRAPMVLSPLKRLGRAMMKGSRS